MRVCASKRGDCEVHPSDALRALSMDERLRRHSACMAWTMVSNPATIMSNLQGRPLRVLLAPPAISPLCCRILLGGSLVMPT